MSAGLILGPEEYLVGESKYYLNIGRLDFGAGGIPLVEKRNPLLSSIRYLGAGRVPWFCGEEKSSP
jgi:hypothetical protein